MTWMKKGTIKNRKQFILCRWLNNFDDKPTIIQTRLKDLFEWDVRQHIKGGVYELGMYQIFSDTRFSTGF